MKVGIFEVCRSPEVIKVTEPLILSRFFTKEGIDFEVYSNDSIWSPAVIISKDFLKRCLKEPDMTIVHLAMHGNRYGFVLKWSKAQDIGARIPEDNLTASDILQMAEWRGKLIVSGGCETSGMASYFLQAGATAVIAPKYPINWPNLGRFFCEFYQALFLGQRMERALETAISTFPEYDCYEIYQTPS